jgi:NAD(P)-dependent dehydrogenase (short-subunit alcohol dehydrogenase family)
MMLGIRALRWAAGIRDRSCACLRRCDTGLSAAILRDRLDKRCDELRAKTPIWRVVGPADVAALLAVHIMINTALTGATYHIDGGQQLVS